MISRTVAIGSSVGLHARPASVLAEAVDDSGVEVTIADNGPGIPPANIDAIFNKGFSTKGENRGVGLFLASQQLRELGGTLAVESEPGVFTQFFVHLPWDSKRKRA